MSKKKDEYERWAESLSDKDLVAAFNRDVRNPGWVYQRQFLLAALKNEFIKRGFDCSEIIKDGCLSFMHKVRLDGNKLVKID